MNKHGERFSSFALLQNVTCEDFLKVFVHKVKHQLAYFGISFVVRNSQTIPESPEGLLDPRRPLFPKASYWTISFPGSLLSPSLAIELVHTSSANLT